MEMWFLVVDSIFYYPGTLASTYWDEKDSRIQFSGSASKSW